MKVVLLAGGSGTRLREETEFKPKSMVTIGNKPMIKHIMDWYAKHGFKDFILALGFKQEIIKEYFYHYSLFNADTFVRTGIDHDVKYMMPSKIDSWSITMSDTGENTLKGGRLKRIEKYVNGDTFMVSYGDGIADVDINKLYEFHKQHGKIATVTGVPPPGRFGELKRDGDVVLSFSEKPTNHMDLINAGFFVFNRKIFDYLDNDCDLEIGALERVTADGEMRVFHHKGYFGCMDTLSDTNKLRQLWESGKAPWKC